MNEESPGGGALPALIAYELLGFALLRSNGFRDGLALSLVLVATLLTGLAVFGKLSIRVPLKVPLLAFAVGQIVLLAVSLPGFGLSPGTSLLPFRLGLLGVLLVTLLYGSPGPLPALRFPLLLALFLALGVWLIRASPAPAIDVWYTEKLAGNLLLHGKNPYAATYPNVYAHGAPFNGHWLPGDQVSHLLYGSNLENGRVVSYWYPPLSILLTLPGDLLGDPRWSRLAALGLTAVLLVVLARRRGRSPPGDPLELVAVLFLFHPRGFVLLEMSWTEPFVALAVVLLFVALARASWVGTALAATLSIKQYSVFCLPALVASGLVGRRSLWRAFAMAAALALPFALWDLRAFWRGVVLFVYQVGPRPDALSVPAWLSVHGGGAFLSTSAVLGMLVAVAAAWVTALRLRQRGRQPDLAALALGAVFLVLFLVNKQAFLNYYWFAGVLLLLAVVVGPVAPMAEREA